MKASFADKVLNLVASFTAAANPQPIEPPAVVPGRANARLSPPTVLEIGQVPDLAAKISAHAAHAE
jgi:hypothetical protein